ncbi:MAG: cobalamin B12-binding domain-containing protein [Candidatus Peribacteria bacterium]|nr:cobalamin B12-binding domain-containing protein [Candidatus Peribacteria bacterium]
MKKYGVFKEGGVERIIAKTGNTLANTLQVIEKNQPDIVGIPLIATSNYIPATTLAKEIKNKFPHIKLIA